MSEQTYGRRLCDKCKQPLPDQWSYLWCKECAQNEKCAHGNSPHECEECIVLSDQSFDAWREKR